MKINKKYIKEHLKNMKLGLTPQETSKMVDRVWSSYKKTEEARNGLQDTILQISEEKGLKLNELYAILLDLIKRFEKFNPTLKLAKEMTDKEIERERNENKL